DDTWLWPSVPGTPALSAGDWPVMDTDPSTLRRVRRRSFSIIDNRNRKGYITRRFQCFPLAPLPENRKYDSLPDLVLHPEQETIKCKEKHYSQPL
ncbi:IncI1-type conjugal transfer protein TraV, partial [Salmonella enterica subsp. enterica serovar Anatum]|nr:IncI1-type conjugal transfer protein TraV [Salmonella enterica subsp. enterica serovar Anatum]